MFKKILVTLDGSALAERALEPAIRLAEKFGGAVILLRVVVPEEIVVAAPGVGPFAYTVQETGVERGCEEAEAYLRAIKVQWLGVNVPVRTTVLVGAPPELILDTAKAENVDLIVMSTHGRSGLNRLLYGSVAEAVLRGAHLPVLLIPFKAN